MGGRPIRINLSSFSLIKGVAIILVVLGHMLWLYDIEQVKVLYPLYFILGMTSSPLMPLFFIISGYSLKEKAPQKMVKMTFKTLIVPYLWVAAIFYPTFAIATYIGYGSLKWGFELSNRYLIAFLLGIPKEGHIIWGIEVRHNTAVWFFLALFISLNLLNLIVRTRKPLHRILLVTACTLIGYFLILRDINYFCLPQGLMAVGCCYVGYLLRQFHLLEHGFTSIVPYFVLIPILLIQGCFGHLNLATGEFRFGILDYFAAICSSLLLLDVFLKAEQCKGKVLDFIREIGIYSYWILCIHSVEETCMQWWLFIDIMPNQLLACFCELLIKILIFTAGCFVLKLISKAKYRRRMLQHAK